MLPILKKLSDFCLYTKKSKDSLAKYYQKKKQRQTKKRARNMDVGDIKTLLNVKIKGWLSIQKKILKS